MPAVESPILIDYDRCRVLHGETLVEQLDLITGTDARLTDARTPLAHTHVTGDVTGLGELVATKLDATDLAVSDPRAPRPHTHTNGDLPMLGAALGAYLPLAGGTMTGDINLTSVGVKGTGAMDVFNTDSAGYQRFGFNGGTGPQFQLFGLTHAQAGASYFDAYGPMSFRFSPGIAASLVLPSADNIPHIDGWNTLSFPANTRQPTGWLNVLVDGVSQLLPTYAEAGAGPEAQAFDILASQIFNN